MIDLSNKQGDFGLRTYPAYHMSSAILQKPLLIINPNPAILNPRPPCAALGENGPQTHWWP